MKPDISNKADIEKVVHHFYEKVKNDKVIGFFFTEVVSVSWQKHLPMMCAFWENILFYTGEYEGNPITIHRNINQKYATTPRHFKRWLFLFDQTVDALFEGPNAEKMKQHSKGIASVMQQNL